ncbi:MAG: COX15/CtaA family protein [Burkholderiaceae bacterium]
MLIHLTAQLAIIGLVVALLPLSVVWVAASADRYRKLVSLTLFLTFDLIVFGGFTRLTDSGLGCPDWPGCYGQANPQQAHADISAAQSAMPGGPVTVVKAWIEMVHRYLAMAVGVLIISLMLLAWWRFWRTRRSAQEGSARRSKRYSSPWLPTLLGAFVCLQGAFGAWTVTLKLQPIIVTTHLLLGLALLGMLAWLKEQQATWQPPSHVGWRASGAAQLRWSALMALVLLAMQLALGGWVSTNYAALACMDYPLCHGQVVPDMDIRQAFSLWRKLGMTAGGDYLPFTALTAIHWAHRNFALVVVATIAWAGLNARGVSGTRRVANALLWAIGLQFATGVSTIYLAWPLTLAVAHNAGAALLVVLLVMLNYRAFAVR